MNSWSIACLPPSSLGAARWLLPAVLSLSLAAGCEGTEEDLSGGAAGAAGDGASPIIPEVVSGECVHPEGTESPNYLEEIGCTNDFEILASEPLDSSIPGARSGKVVLDTESDDQLYYQNSQLYQIHHEFALNELNTAENPIPELASFNVTEYFSPERRFILGAVTHYEGPDIWALQLAPYDRANAGMIERLYRAIEESSFFGPALRFHTQTAYLEGEAAKLPDDIFTVTTEELFEGIDYQPLNPGEGMGLLKFMTAEQLETDYVSYEDIVVLDRVPNDIAVIAGLITEEFQTPLSHVNVLSQSRDTPNMGLRGATTDEELRALEGQWVHLVVGAFGYTIEAVDAQTAQEFIEAKKPEAAVVTPYDASVTGLLDIETIVVPAEGEHLKDAISAAVPVVGGKAAHYSWLAQIPDVPVPKAFAIPAHYYDQYMTENGFHDRVAAMLSDPDFIDSPAERDAQLQALRDDMLVGVVNQELQELLRQKLETDYPDESTMRFRSSTNAEDLDGFTGAGLYTSKTGEVANWVSVLDSMREVWSSVWYYRAFDEREYRGIVHQDVAMSLLVHHNFPEEEANGVAITNNRFDTSGLNPAFYVNVQLGDYSVVQPEVGVTTDEFIYYYDAPNTPIVYISESNLVTTEGEHVLTARQVHDLGTALDAIHTAFSPAYGPASGLNDGGWYAMDTEFKFDDRGAGDVRLFMKQARPYPGPSQ